MSLLEEAKSLLKDSHSMSKLNDKNGNDYKVEQHPIERSLWIEILSNRNCIVRGPPVICTINNWSSRTSLMKNG